MFEKVVLALHTWCPPLACREGRKVSPEDLKDLSHPLIIMVQEHKLGCDGWNDAYLCRRCFILLGSLSDIQRLPMTPFSLVLHIHKEYFDCPQRDSHAVHYI